MDDPLVMICKSIIWVQEHADNWPWYAWLMLYYAVLNLYTYFTFWRDKRKAQNGGWRISEGSLHMLELLGGWPGAILAIFKLRHKCSKWSFLIMTFSTMILHVLAVAWVFCCGEQFWKRLNAGTL